MTMMKRMLFSLLFILIGIGLIIGNMTHQLDSFWSGLGGGFLVIGLFQCMREIRYRISDDYREKIETEKNDERNRHIYGLAWSWAAMSYLVLSAISIIVLKILGIEELILGLSVSIGFLVLLFLVSYIYLKKKY